MLTSLGLWVIGDTCAQAIEGAKDFDWHRLGLSAAFGFGFVGPVGHLWYDRLDYFTKGRFAPGSLRFVSTKVFADTLLFGPVYTATFFTYMTCMRGGSIQDVKRKLQEDFPPTFATQCAFWIPYQYLNFWAIPVRHQLLAVNLAAILDTTFLSWCHSQGNVADLFRNLLLSQAAGVQQGGNEDKVVQ